MDYFDINLNLSDTDMALKEAVHKFAKEVMRPVAKELDEMSPVDVVADSSPLWDFLKQAYALGYHTTLLPDYVGGMGLTPLQISIVNEEMGWGSFGLAVQLAVVQFSALGAVYTNETELLEKFAVPFCECRDGSIRSCWGGTEPDHGSDIIPQGEKFYYEPKRTGCVAVRDGDEYVINGQKSSWVSGGTIANQAWLHVQLKTEMGLAGWGCCLISLDQPGVSKGKPLNKLGQRDLNQGELFFDDVRLPVSHMVADEDFHEPLIGMFLTNANIWMSQWATGLARAAFEEAFKYTKERVQGGRLLKDHYSMQQRVFELFRRTEVARSISRSMAELNFNIAPGFKEYSIAAKNTATEMALQNAHDAIQILGGNGIAREYLPEKLYRDARMALVEDGNNEVLAKAGGHLLYERYPVNRNSL